MALTCIHSGLKQGNALWEFRRDLYRGDPKYILPIRRRFLERFENNFSFSSAIGSEFVHLVATAEGRFVGHAMAAYNPDLHDADGTPVGTIGMFEAIEDQAVVTDLLDAAVSWLTDRGIKRIWGPMDHDIWNGYRFMIDGFERVPFAGEPYQKRSYPERWQTYGFQPRQEWDSIEIVGRNDLAALVKRGEHRFNDIVGRGYRFARFDLTHATESIGKLYAILTSAFHGFLGFTPITRESFERIVRPQLVAIDPRLFTIITDEEGRPAGFAGAMLELSDAIRAMNGSDGFLAKAKFLVHRARTSRVNFFFGGITREEAARHTGLGRAGFTWVVKSVFDAGYERMIVALRVRDNYSRAFCAGMNTRNVRRYALFQLEKLQ